METYHLHFGNCLDYLRTLATASVALLLIDSPYENTDLPFDKQPVDWPAIWVEIKRVLTAAGIVLCFACESFTLDLIASNRAWYCYRRVWVKSKGTRYLDKAWRPLATHEDIVVFSPAIRSSTYNPQKTYSTGPRKNTQRKTIKQSHYKSQRYAAAYEDDGTRYPTTVLYYPSVGTTAPHFNPTAKPLALFEEFVLTYSNPGDKVVELYAGDAPAGLACIKYGRQYHGCENDPVQYQWSAARLRKAAAQPQLALA
jgi:site-specific DNA-methyltransferase (adenine-specific)